MEYSSSDVFQSRQQNNLSGLTVPARCLRLGMMPMKIPSTLCAVSAERQGKEENIFGKKKKAVLCKWHYGHTKEENSIYSTVILLIRNAEFV